MEKLSICNLEFPTHIHTLKIGDYEFQRIKDYEQALLSLQHLVDSSGVEFHRKPNTGTHQITAIVKIPEKEKLVVLPWANKNLTQLQDVLFLLTLFGGRNVFHIEEEHKGKPLIADSRMHGHGGQLILSTHKDIRWKNIETGKIISEKEMKGRQASDWAMIDLGFEKTLNEILKLISSSKWQDECSGGYFLFLYRQAIQRQIAETAFLSCWTIWEHLFSLHNRHIDEEVIWQISGAEKISFILNKYFLVEIDEAAKEEIKRITKARNRIIHYGIIPDNVDLGEMEMFIRLTEQIMAIVFKLQPSNAFNSFEKLENFLKEER